jgi:hypothetical protein
MSEERYKKLGSEKQKDVNTNFDSIYEKYRLKALKEGFSGEIKFVKERGRVIIFVEIGSCEP